MSTIWRALVRSRVPIVSLALVHLLFVLIGAAMVHTGNQFALSYRDNLVANASKNDPASLANQRGDRVTAALVDFSRNLFLGAVPSTVGGLAVVIPYPVAAHRAWVGGIVSVKSDHTSRLADLFSGLYYVSVVILQLIPYTLAGGAGVNLGLAYLRPAPFYRGRKWRGLPVEALRDLLRIYLLVVPLFLVASLWEFTSPWN
jgi:hypothetical protein